MRYYAVLISFLKFKQEYWSLWEKLSEGRSIDPLNLLTNVKHVTSFQMKSCTLNFAEKPQPLEQLGYGLHSTLTITFGGPKIFHSRSHASGLFQVLKARPGYDPARHGPANNRVNSLIVRPSPLYSVIAQNDLNLIATRRTVGHSLASPLLRYQAWHYPSSKVWFSKSHKPSSETACTGSRTPTMQSWKSRCVLDIASIYCNISNIHCSWLRFAVKTYPQTF